MDYAIGSGGPFVQQIQNALIAHGFTVGSSGVDGQFGSDTQAAVLAFQQANGLTQDGIVGPDTAAALGLTLPTSSGASSSTPSSTPAPAQSSSLMKWALYGVAGWFGYKWLKK